MSKVTVALVTVQAELPAGVVAGNLRFSLIDATGAVVASQDVADPAVVFTSVADGVYTVSAQKLDSNFNALGNPVVSDAVSVATVVTPPVAFYDAPSALTITVSAD